MNENVSKLFKALKTKFGETVVMNAITAENHGTIEYTVDGVDGSILIDELMDEDK